MGDPGASQLTTKRSNDKANGNHGAEDRQKATPERETRTNI